MLKSTIGVILAMRHHFENISDPRQAWKIEHNLLEIIIMTICAVISGCDYWDDIVDFSRVKETWFREKLGLKLEKGIASHDTFQRIFQIVGSDELEASFMSWVKSIAQQTNGEIVSIDGKTVCGSRDAKTRAIHMVSACANANRLVLGQVKTPEKSNETTAIPTLLDLLELKKALMILASEIDYLRTPLPMAAGNIAKRTERWVAAFFARFGELLAANDGETAYQLWLRAFAECKSAAALTDEDAKVVDSFGKTLGYLDKQMQQNAIDYAVRYIDETAATLQAQSKKNEKMYRSLGVIGGLLLAVVLW